MGVRGIARRRQSRRHPQCGLLAVVKRALHHLHFGSAQTQWFTEPRQVLIVSQGGRGKHPTLGPFGDKIVILIQSQRHLRKRLSRVQRAIDPTPLLAHVEPSHMIHICTLAEFFEPLAQVRQPIQ